MCSSDLQRAVSGATACATGSGLVTGGGGGTRCCSLRQGLNVEAATPPPLPSSQALVHVNFTHCKPGNFIAIANDFGAG